METSSNFFIFLLCVIVFVGAQAGLVPVQQGVAESSEEIVVGIINTFLGLTYAKTPTGEIRSLIPNQPINAQLLKPVIVYLPGEKFRYDVRSTIKPDNILESPSNREVVIVALNELGLLGFMSTENKILPGNMGSPKIAKNIEKFGGNPGNDSAAGSFEKPVSKKSKGFMSTEDKILPGNMGSPRIAENIGKAGNDSAAGSFEKPVSKKLKGLKEFATGRIRKEDQYWYCKYPKVYRECQKYCPRLCEDIHEPRLKLCSEDCVAGCFCVAGLLLKKNGCCVTPAGCVKDLKPIGDQNCMFKTD